MFLITAKIVFKSYFFYFIENRTILTVCLDKIIINDKYKKKKKISIIINVV